MIVHQNLQHSRMGERSANFLLPVETINKCRIVLHSRMRNLERDRLVRLKVCAAENGRYIVAGDDAIEAIMIELSADIHMRMRGPPQVAAISFFSIVGIMSFLGTDINAVTKKLLLSCWIGRKAGRSACFGLGSKQSILRTSDR